MNSRIASLMFCSALSLTAIGCATSDSYREDPVVTTTRSTTVYDDGYAYRRRAGERLFEAPVTSAHAVVGPTEQHCWIEREQVSARPNVGGAIAGAVVGGILGHQIGAGRGRDVATVGGAAVGGAIGANAGRTRGYDRDVRRCETVASTTPDYWDVTYDWRGVEHRVQMIDPPGSTVMVNRNGEPRG